MRFFLLVLALGVAAALPAAAAGADRFRISGSAAAGQAGDQSYATVGLGIGYRIVAGLEAGVDAEGWFRDGGPDLYKLSPGLLYRYDRPGFSPYLGAFYRRTIVEGAATNYDSVGGRAGVSSRIGPQVTAGAGIVYERLLDCEETPGASCSSLYPEANISFSF